MSDPTPHERAIAAINDLLPYAVAAIGLPRQAWPQDSVILQAEAFVADLKDGRVVVVPAEPTREMWAAMGDALVGYKQRHHDAVAAELYSALLTAAQGKEADRG